jgi:uncharacterized protein YjbI with pentapeptide repeats
MQLSPYTRIGSPLQQQRSGVGVDPETLKHGAEIVFHGVQQVGHVLNSDTPAIRNTTALFGSLLASTAAGFAYIKYIRETPAAKFAKLSEGVQAQKTKLDEPCITMQEWLEEVVAHCKEAVKNPKTYHAITPTSQKMADKAQAVMESALARETISNDFEANLTGKKGLDFSTLTISGMRANAQFPKTYWYDRLAQVARDTWLEERALGLQGRKIQQKKQERRLQPTFDAREAIVKNQPPVKRFQFEQGKAPFGEWRNFNTTYGNMRKANLANKLFVWNKFNGSDFSEANLYKSKWFNNDIEQCNFQGARLRKSKFAGVNGWRADFSPYVENSYKPANCIYREAHLEDAIFYATDYDPHILDAWIDVNNNLPKADFRSAKLQCITFQQANLNGAKFGSVQINPQLVKPDEVLYDERNVWDKFTPPQAANLTGATLGDVDMRNIEAEGATFEDMRFLGTVPKAASLAMPDGKTVMHYRTVRDTPVVSFAGAKLQNTRWKGTELTKVNRAGETVPAVTFARADISNADFSEALVEGTTIKQLFEEALSGCKNADKITRRLSLYFDGVEYSPFKPPNVTGTFLDSSKMNLLEEKAFKTKG